MMWMQAFRKALGLVGRRSHQARQKRDLWRLAFAILVVAGALAAQGVEAESSNGSYQEATATFLSGVVTAKSARILQVNNTNYVLHKEMRVQDDEGRIRTLNDLRRGSHVQFHLNRGKVDQVILILAR